MFIVFTLVGISIILVSEFLYLKNLIPRAFAFWGLDLSKKGVKAARIVVTVILLFCSVLVFSIVGMAVLHFLAISAIIDLCCLIARLIAKKNPKGLQFISSSGIVPIILCAVVIVYGYVNMYNVIKTEYMVDLQKDLSREYKVAFVSDIHTGISLSSDEIQKMCEEINEQKPDLLLLGGDIVDESTTKEEMKDVFLHLSKIKTTYGTYFVYGNHDTMKLGRGSFTKEELESTITSLGITILTDDTISIGDDILLIGRLDASFRDESKEMRASLSSLTKDLDKEKMLFLLDHQPREYEAAKSEGIDLIMSGHTHGGQIWPAGIVTTLIAPNEMNYGYETDGTFHAIVSSGVAGWGFPIKTAKPCEYLIVTIK